MVDIPPQPATNPQILGVQVIEVTGANLDLTTGAEGMATPPTNDHQNSAGLLVGLHSSFRREGLEKLLQNILNIIKNGSVYSSIHQQTNCG